MKTYFLNAARIIFSLAISISFQASAKSGAAIFTPFNLNELELDSGLTKEQEIEGENAAKIMESDMLEQGKMFQEAYDSSMEMIPTSNNPSDVEISLYQETPGIKWTFLVAKENGVIRYVFATSPGMKGHSTPVSPKDQAWGIIAQSWRHTSTKYATPKGNMDHVSYFLPLYGMHSTVLGAYHKLGQRDSHGCVRLGRPEARAMYRLIARNLPRVKVYSFKNQRPPEEEVKEILPLLAMDLNFIQKELLAAKNPGDVPFNTAQQYFEYKSFQEKNDLEKVQKINQLLNIKFIREIYPEQDHFSDPKIINSLHNI
ncbi:MAG: L,D-transpeptidase [Pseudobdellovibrionaceae bacterium]